MSFDVIIVGSGPCGEYPAALELRDRNVLILDVGFQAPEFPYELPGNFIRP
jgi:thioredoxin reductase